MNKKAEAFKKYLEEKQITCFQWEEIPKDPLNTVAFRSVMEIAGQNLPTVIILDSSIYAMVRVQVATNVVKGDNEAALHKLLNRLNSQYKIFKYYVAPDNTLVLDSYILAAEVAEGDMIYTVLRVMIQQLEKEYSNIMQVIWA